MFVLIIIKLIFSSQANICHVTIMKLILSRLGNQFAKYDIARENIVDKFLLIRITRAVCVTEKHAIGYY